MRPDEEYQQALELIEAGVNDCEVGRRLGIPRETIRYWRVDGRSGRQTRGCFRCEEAWDDEEGYAYLLGAYLGDGWIWEARRDLYQLRIACDLRYPDIINEIATHILIVRGVDKVGFAPREGCVDVNAYWKHWRCVFPSMARGESTNAESNSSPGNNRSLPASPRL